MDTLPLVPEQITWTSYLHRDLDTCFTQFTLWFISSYNPCPSAVWPQWLPPWHHGVNKPQRSCQGLPTWENTCVARDPPLQCYYSPLGRFMQAWIETWSDAKAGKTVDWFQTLNRHFEESVCQFSLQLTSHFDELLSTLTARKAEEKKGPVQYGANHQVESS